MQAIHASAKKSFIPSYIVLLVIAFLIGILWVSNLLGDPIDLLSNPTDLFAGFIWLLLGFLCIVEFVCYFTWRSKAKVAAERGEFLKRKKVSRGVNRIITMLTSFIVAFAMMGAITFGTIYASDHGFFADKNEETYEHNGMTWMIHQDEIPLVVEDLVDVDFNGYIKERRGNVSLFMGQLVMCQYPRYDAKNIEDYPKLEYTVTIINVPALYEMCKNQTIDKKDETDNTDIPEDFKRMYLEQDPTPWKANEVYQLAYQDVGTLNRYILCYDDRIIEINFNWEPTAEQMAIIAEKLNAG